MTAATIIAVVNFSICASNAYSAFARRHSVKLTPDTPTMRLLYLYDPIFAWAMGAAAWFMYGLNT